MFLIKESLIITNDTDIWQGGTGLFDEFLKVHGKFENQEFDSPVIETLKLYDFLSDGALRNVSLEKLKEAGLSLEELVAQRKKGVPFEYIVGGTTFMGLNFHCAPGALIPRQETELLVKIALDLIARQAKQGMTIIDMGTGCGNISVTLARHSENATILASDLKPEVINIAKKNVERHKVQDRVLLFHGDLFTSFHGETLVEEGVDMVVCNPPYIPTASLKKLDPEVIGHEPVEAFDAGAYGIDFYRRLINDAEAFLLPKGILVFEIGIGQEKLVTRIVNKNKGYTNVGYYDDGKDIRVMSMEKKG